MMKDSPTSKLPLFMQNSKINKIMQEVISCVPKKTKVYLVGGAIRNAIYYKYFKKKLPQRDYDITLIGNTGKFISNLKNKKFIYGKVIRKDEIVLKKEKIPNAKRISDYVVLDIHISKKNPIRKIMKEKANFTFNCSILPLKEVNSIDWFNKVISFPGALDDLKNKKIKVNSLSHPANLFACVRFMSKGFKKPKKEEIFLLLKSLKTVPEDIFEKSVKKVFDYVGGEKKARLLVKKLGIVEDIFNYEVVKRL